MSNGRTIGESLRARPIVCFANDWSGDPTSKHHVMRTLSDFTDVLWVESSGMRTPSLLSPSDLKRIGTKILRSRKGAVPQETGLKVVSPLSLPFPRSRTAQWLNRKIFGRAVSRARRTSADPLLWVYTPTVAPFLDDWPNQGIVYHCVDRWWEFTEFDADLMRGCHKDLCEKADVTFASSAGLLTDCEVHTDRAHLIRHGVDWEHFAQAAAETQPVPEDIAHISGPVIGFFGLIHDWIDQDLILAVAETYPDATVVIIGNNRVDVARLERAPNVLMIGQKPYAELPAYAARFTVGLIPFVVNELTLAVNPIKLREYLSAGVPVVSTALPEVLAFESRSDVKTEMDEAGFLRAVGEILDEGEGKDVRLERSRSMQVESWLGRCQTMVSLVDR